MAMIRVAPVDVQVRTGLVQRQPPRDHLGRRAPPDHPRRRRPRRALRLPRDHRPAHAVRGRHAAHRLALTYRAPVAALDDRRPGRGRQGRLTHHTRGRGSSLSAPGSAAGRARERSPRGPSRPAPNADRTAAVRPAHRSTAIGPGRPYNRARGTERALPRPDGRRLRRTARRPPIPSRAVAARRPSRRASPRALVAMVASLSEGRPKYAEHAALHAEAAEAARALADRLLALADEDAEAYAGFGVGDEAAARHGRGAGGPVRGDRRGRAGPRRTCRSETVEACLEVVALAEALAGRSNTQRRRRTSRWPRSSPTAARARPRPTSTSTCRRSATRPRPASCSPTRQQLVGDVDRLASLTRELVLSGEATATDRDRARVSDPGPRLLLGAPIAAEIRAVGRPGRRRHPRPSRPRPGPRRRHRRQRRAVGRLPQADPAVVREGRDRRPARRDPGARVGDDPAHRDRAPQPRTRSSPGSSSRCRCPSGSRSRPSSTRSIRPRTSTASTRATPACSASATTGSCRRPPTPRSRS